MYGSFRWYLEMCAGTSRATAGTNNAEIWPESKQDGRAKDEYYAMFAMAPENLTSRVLRQSIHYLNCHSA